MKSIDTRILSNKYLNLIKYIIEFLVKNKNDDDNNNNNSIKISKIKNSFSILENIYCMIFFL